MEKQGPKILFVTGRLAEYALRREVKSLARHNGIEAEIAVLPISVAALMTPRWVARHLRIPEGTQKVILPGHCKGDLASIRETSAATIELGPIDLRDLPSHFGMGVKKLEDYGGYDIEILAEINHAPTLSIEAIVAMADRFRSEGADVVDLGCDPGETWLGVGDAVRSLKDQGHRVAIDSFNSDEVEAAVAAGAELVLSVNATNRDRAGDWGVEVVAIPDTPGTLEGLEETIELLTNRGVRFRVDPILEPIGFGFAGSLQRYIETRDRHPEVDLLMGTGNLTELTDVDSAGVNVILAGFCQEIGVRSVLTTAVIPWAQSSVRELDLARRLVRHAVRQRTLPKHIEPRLVILRDPKRERFGALYLADLAQKIRDPNWRIFAEDGQIHVMNAHKYIIGTDPFEIFEQMGVADASHAFYLGRELMKAKTALTLGKSYVQDESLDWGFLTEPETSHRKATVPGAKKLREDAR